MPTYVIGDIQGCFGALEKLLARLFFDEHKDVLWFTGDLVNRGPQSLAVLRFVKELGAKHKTVLGNHDIHLLAVAYETAHLHHTDTLKEILIAPDAPALIDWLRHCPLLVHDKKTGFVMTHAGLAPAWTLAQAKSLAKEVEELLRSPTPAALLANIYGDQPNQWRDELTGVERWRCIINYFTRMRFCDENGCLELAYKGPVDKRPPHLIPWFNVSPRANAEEKIIFGHWAALSGKADAPRVYALDTGCVWGKCLTAFCLETHERFSVSCKEYKQ